MYNCRKLFWKNYFLYDFWCAKTCSFRAIFGLPSWSLALCSDVRKFFLYMNIYVLGLKPLWWNFIKIFLLSIWSGAHKLFRRFFDFSQFLIAILRKLWRHQLTKMRTIYPIWKGNPFWKKLKTAPKSTHKQRHKTCSKYTPWNEQRADLGTWQKQTYKHNIFALTAGARCSISPKLCMVVQFVVPILKGDNHFSIQFLVFPLGAKWFLATEYRI